jgi:hypothetical protein
MGEVIMRLILEGVLGKNWGVHGVAQANVETKSSTQNSAFLDKNPLPQLVKVPIGHLMWAQND